MKTTLFFSSPLSYQTKVLFVVPTSAFVCAHGNFDFFFGVPFMLWRPLKKSLRGHGLTPPLAASSHPQVLTQVFTKFVIGNIFGTTCKRIKYFINTGKRVHYFHSINTYCKHWFEAIYLDRACILRKSEACFAYGHHIGVTTNGPRTGRPVKAIWQTYLQFTLCWAVELQKLNWNYQDNLPYCSHIVHFGLIRVIFREKTLRV